MDELPEAEREAVKGLCETTRVALACDLLSRPVAGGESFLTRLGSRYDLDLFTFGRGLARTTAAEVGLGLAPTGAPSFAENYFRSATDFTAAMEGVLKDKRQRQFINAAFKNIRQSYSHFNCAVSIIALSHIHNSRKSAYCSQVQIVKTVFTARVSIIVSLGVFFTNSV